MKSILDRSFRYTPAVQTDLKKTFARLRREQEKQAEARAEVEAEAKRKVAPLKRGRA